MKFPIGLQRAVMDAFILSELKRAGYPRATNYGSIVVFWRGREYELTCRPYISDDVIRHQLKRAAEFTNPRDGLDNIRRAIGNE